MSSSEPQASPTIRVRGRRGPDQDEKDGRVILFGLAAQDVFAHLRNNEGDHFHDKLGTKGFGWFLCISVVALALYRSNVGIS